MRVFDDLGWNDPDRRDDALDRLAIDLSRAPLVPEAEIESYVHLGGRMRPENLRSVPSARELEVLDAISRDGMGTAAERLGIALSTVRGHVRHVIYLLDARNVTEAVAIAIRRGLI